jgi:hypothetical protein
VLSKARRRDSCKNCLKPDEGSKNPSLADLLERAGYRVRGQRADCPHCEGRSRLTVSVSFADGVFHCHRCQKSGNVRTLARELGSPLPPLTPEERAERTREAQFSDWVDACHIILAGRLRYLTRRAELAKRVLACCPDCEPAWDALATLYHAEAEILGALDMLSFEKVSPWLENPMTRDALLLAFTEAQKVVSRAA